MTLDSQKVKEMFWLFSKVLPLDESKSKQQINSIFGKEFSNLIPDLALSIGDLGSKNLEILDLYLDFIVDAIQYMRNEKSDLPDMDDPDYLVKLEMKKALEEFEKNAKPIKL